MLERALSIRQPYVELIFRGSKRAEYRNRPTQIRGRIYVYASLKPGDVEYGARRGISREAFDALPRGVIVGSVDLVGCRRRGDDDFAWVLAWPRRYSKPVPVQGQQPQPAFWRPKWR
jgi:predicted transcriptional regulator